MRTTLLSAIAALVLTSTCSVSSFAQHDDDILSRTGWRWVSHALQGRQRRTIGGQAR